MTFVSLADGCRRLGIDAKTLRRWLVDAQLPFQSHPHDGRKKGVSSQHLQALARLHQRSLAPLPQEPPVPALSASHHRCPPRSSPCPRRWAPCKLRSPRYSSRWLISPVSLSGMGQSPPSRWLPLSRPGRPSVHLSPHPLLPALVPQPSRSASRLMSCLASSMDQKDATS